MFTIYTQKVFIGTNLSIFATCRCLMGANGKRSQLNKFYVSMEEKSKYMLLKYKLSIPVDLIKFDPD